MLENSLLRPTVHDDRYDYSQEDIEAYIADKNSMVIGVDCDICGTPLRKENGNENDR